MAGNNERKCPVCDGCGLIIKDSAFTYRSYIIGCPQCNGSGTVSGCEHKGELTWCQYAEHDYICNDCGQRLHYDPRILKN